MGEREEVFLVPVQKGDAICIAIDGHKLNDSVLSLVFNFTGSGYFSFPNGF